MYKYKQRKINGKKELDHRVVMEGEMQRKLSSSEYVHHKNGNGRDNRIKNLKVMSPLEHAQHHNQKYPKIKICELCGKEYEPPPTKRKRAKTCSNECRYKLISKKLRQPDKPHSLYRKDAYPCEKKKQLSLK